MDASSFVTPRRRPLQPLSLPTQTPSSPAGPASSPLNPYSGLKSRHSLPKSAPAPNRKAEYKARRASFCLLPPPEPAYSSFLRQKMKAKCAERVKKDKEKSRKKWQSSSSEGGSSDVEMDDEADEVDDPMYARIMEAEARRNAHLQKYLYERQVGSSYDPLLEEEMAGAEWDEDDEYPDETDDLELLAQYEADFDCGEGLPSQEADANMDSITPSVSIESMRDSRNHFMNHLLGGSCPQCSQQALTVSPTVEEAILCGSCGSTFPLTDVASSWSEDHPAIDPSHVPSWEPDPIDPTHAILMQCTNPRCFWTDSV